MLNVYRNFFFQNIERRRLLGGGVRGLKRAGSLGVFEHGAVTAISRVVRSVE
jgi:hypothetical protein